MRGPGERRLSVARGTHDLARRERRGCGEHEGGQQQGAEPSGHRHQYTLAHSTARLSRSAFPITDTELTLIAAAAIIGDSSRPTNGYSTPAATGTPAAL